MPLIHVYHAHDSLSAERKSALGQMLTEVLLEIEGGTVALESPKARSIAWVLFHEIAADGWLIGGQVDETYVSPPGKFLVRVQVPEGSLSKERKATVHRRVDEAFYEVFGLGTPPAADQRWPSIFVHIHEWIEGNVGGLGKTWGLADIGAYATGAGNPEVRQRSKDYLKALFSWRTSAGFPE